MIYLNLKIALTFIVVFFITGCSAKAAQINSYDLKGDLRVHAEDVANYNPQTGVGCLVKEDPNNTLQAHIVCRSKHSGEDAWNAVMARSKRFCASEKWKMLFKRPPSLPIKNKIHGAQMDIRCIK